MDLETIQRKRMDKEKLFPRAIMNTRSLKEENIQV